MRFTGSQDGWRVACFDVLGIGQAAGGVASAAGSVASATIQANAAEKAAADQEATQKQAAATLQAAGQTAQTTLSPYVAGGQQSYKNLLATSGTALSDPTADQSSAIQTMQNGLNSLGNSGSALNTLSQGPNAEQQQAASTLGTLQNGPTQAQLAATPGYQFELAQGLESTNNSAAARGLASSGAALKGADAYATGTAQQTYQNNYQDMLGTAGAQASLGQNEFTNALGTSAQQQSLGQNYLQGSQTGLAINASQQANVQQAFNDANTLAGYGQTAAGTSVNTDLAAAGGSAAYQAGAGTAAASGLVGGANAASSGLTNLGNTAQQYAAYSSLLNGGNADNDNSAFGGAGTSF